MFCDMQLHKKYNCKIKNFPPEEVKKKHGIWLSRNGQMKTQKAQKGMPMYGHIGYAKEMTIRTDHDMTNAKHRRNSFIYYREAKM